MRAFACGMQGRMEVGKVSNRLRYLPASPPCKHRSCDTTWATAYARKVAVNATSSLNVTQTRNSNQREKLLTTEHRPALSTAKTIHSYSLPGENNATRQLNQNPTLELQKVFSCRLFPVLTAFLCAITFGTSAVLLAQPAQADEQEFTSISTATITASYSHPVTGVIADSGGESNAALGQSMVTGTTHETALVEVDEDGLTWVTLRFNLASYLSVLSILYATPEDSDNFTETEVTLMQEDDGEDTADYRFEVPSVDCILEINLDVVPMGRAVVYYATLSDLVDSNTDGFVETVIPGQSIGATEEEEEETATSETETNEVAETEAEAVAAETDVDETDQETSSGVSVPLVVGGIVVVVIIVAIVGYLVMRKLKQPETQSAGEEESAAAASVSDGYTAGDTASEGKSKSADESAFIDDSTAESSESGADSAKNAENSTPAENSETEAEK